MSGSLQGAGGIGGLLSASIGGTNVVYGYDANGNVTDLVDTNGTLVAHYEYDPFGRMVVAEGAMATMSLFRFSTKHWDDATGLGYWGYRYYHPELGRWLSRDPIGEMGGPNLSLLVRNSSVNIIDSLGLFSIDDRVSLIPGIGTIHSAYAGLNLHSSAIDGYAPTPQVMASNADKLMSSSVTTSDAYVSSNIKDRLNRCLDKFSPGTQEPPLRCMLRCALKKSNADMAKCMAGCISKALSTFIVCCLQYPPDQSGHYRDHDELCYFRRCRCLINAATSWDVTLPVKSSICETQLGCCLVADGD